MEPYVILAIAAVALIVFYIVWSNRSRRTRTPPEDSRRRTDREQHEPKLGASGEVLPIPVQAVLAGNALDLRRGPGHDRAGMLGHQFDRPVPPRGA